MGYHRGPQLQRSLVSTQGHEAVCVCVCGDTLRCTLRGHCSECPLLGEEARSLGSKGMEGRMMEGHLLTYSLCLVSITFKVGRDG